MFGVRGGGLVWGFGFSEGFGGSGLGFKYWLELEPQLALCSQVLRRIGFCMSGALSMNM